MRDCQIDRNGTVLKISAFEAMDLQQCGHVRTQISRFGKVWGCLNLGPNIVFSFSCSANFELNFGQVQRSSGSNQGSELNCSSTKLELIFHELCTQILETHLEKYQHKNMLFV